MRSNRRNADYQTRVWPGLTNPETGRTLELKAGEVVKNIDTTDDFDDPLLPEVETKASRRSEPKEEPKSEPVNASPAEPATEEKSE